MREIKFRYWDEEERAMKPVVGMYFEYREPTIIENIGEQFKEDVGRLPIMQFTGLKDKNGKEIYEGDVLKKEGHRNRIVQWTKDAFTLQQIPEHEGDNPYRLKDFIHDAEVIGNIYENPELLTL